MNAPFPGMVVAVPAAVRQPRAARKSASHGEAGYARRPHDAYFTEPWVTRVLLQAIDFASGSARGDTVIWEPACGDGRMAREIEAAGYAVVASDIADWGYGRPGFDFLGAAALDARLGAGARREVAAIVTNPPFGDQTVLFARRALELMRPGGGKVALLQRHEWDAAAERHTLMDRHPFRCKIVLPRRPRWSDEDKASPRFPYAWYVWDWACPMPQATLYMPNPDALPKALGSLL